MVWCLFLLYAKHHRGQNGSVIRFYIYTFPSHYCLSTGFRCKLIPRIIVQVMSNLLYYYGMCGLLKECLLYRYFSKVLNVSLKYYSWKSRIRKKYRYRFSSICIRMFVVVLKFQNRTSFKHVEELVLKESTFCYFFILAHFNMWFLHFFFFLIYLIQLLDERQSTNVLRFLQAIDR